MVERKQQEENNNAVQKSLLRLVFSRFLEVNQRSKEFSVQDFMEDFKRQLGLKENRETKSVSGLSIDSIPQKSKGESSEFDDKHIFTLRAHPKKTNRLGDESGLALERVITKKINKNKEITGELNRLLREPNDKKYSLEEVLLVQIALREQKQFKCLDDLWKSIDKDKLMAAKNTVTRQLAGLLDAKSIKIHKDIEDLLARTLDHSLNAKDISEFEKDSSAKRREGRSLRKLESSTEATRKKHVYQKKGMSTTPDVFKKFNQDQRKLPNGTQSPLKLDDLKRMKMTDQIEELVNEIGCEINIGKAATANEFRTNRSVESDDSLTAAGKTVNEKINEIMSTNAGWKMQISKKIKNFKIKL